MSFQPNDHLSKIKTKNGMQDYLKVQYRLVWFRDAAPDGTIETHMVHLDTEHQLAVFKAEVADGKGAIATGHGSETAKDFTDYIEKAETKAIGRALAALGFGTQFTGDELDEGERIVDAPVAPPSTRDLHDLTKPGSYEQHHRSEATSAAAPASNGHAEPDIVIDNLKARILKVQQRAFATGITKKGDWAAFRKQYAEVDSDEQLTVVGLAKMGGELTIREKASVTAGT